MQTPRLLKAALDGYSQRIHWEHRDKMTAAWHGAAFGRVKKMPALDKVVGEKRAVPVHSPEQMLAAMQSLVGKS
ncbi:hypothetical protein V475_20320 [Sphingobium baderi LL03]|uniref:Uncharacterized protein n=1 Tax=Sphingobium baderi LL03 TaxID=1114964 RepID=T0FZQ8_9SPHN|nr:hypothetical protein L485_22480 [Sphingobium baderi LL03]KMS64136.1 hypothetical protein V475_20320 [Sphingobium baderi LL03]